MKWTIASFTMTLSCFALLISVGCIRQKVAPRTPNNSHAHSNIEDRVPVQNVPHPYSVFDHFSPDSVALTTEDETYYYIESDGVPAGELMVGITSWQQQVVLPQNYQKENAWALIKQPKPASVPLSLAKNLYKGAVGVAVDGTPIFNPLNNRGEDAYLAGELDHLGGHAGRADDYHYHIAPTHLNRVIGDKYPIAFMLDGYPLYGLNEPRGKPVDPSGLDDHHGHEHDEMGYHYHASTEYPYINRNMYGKVSVSSNLFSRENQIVPQPRTEPVRKHLEPLRGARITNFEQNTTKTDFALTYSYQGSSYTLSYMLRDGVWIFKIPNHDGTHSKQTYQAKVLSRNTNDLVHLHSH